MSKSKFARALLSDATSQKSNDILSNIIVDEELKTLIPPLSDEERAQLEANIAKEGCREKIQVWWSEALQSYVIADGHNRYEICRSLGINFSITVLDLPDREALKDWMINNQLGRRNVTKEAQAYLRGLQYERMKKKQPELNNLKQFSGVDILSTSGEGERTAEIIAQQHNVSAKTIRRDNKFAKGVDAIGEVNPNLKKQILQGQANINKNDVEVIGDLLEDVNKEALAFSDESDVARTAQELRKQKTKTKQSVSPKAEDEEAVAISNQIHKLLQKAAKEKDGSFISKVRELLDSFEKLLSGKN